MDIQQKLENCIHAKTDVCLILAALNPNWFLSGFHGPAEIVLHRPLAQFHLQAKHLQKIIHLYVKLREFSIDSQQLELKVFRRQSPPENEGKNMTVLNTN